MVSSLSLLHVMLTGFALRGTNESSVLFVVLVESVFGIDDIRLTKDPGYRHVGRSNLGESVVVVVFCDWCCCPLE